MVLTIYSYQTHSQDRPSGEIERTISFFSDELQSLPLTFCAGHEGQVNQRQA